MFEYRNQQFLPGWSQRLGGLSAVLLLLSFAPTRHEPVAVSAETWHLNREGNWQELSEKREDKYLPAVAQIKKLVSAGETDAVRSAVNRLRQDFPAIAGPDLDAFMEAEVLFSEGELAKAGKAYDKFLSEFPESELYEAALHRQFAIGTAFLAGRKISVLGIFKMRGYATGEKIMEKLSDRAGETPLAVKASLSVAESYEQRGKFNQAYQQWSQISSRWPTGRTGKDALLAMARCKHAAYKGPAYDPSNLISAKSYYENFKLRYPEDAEELGVDEILKQITEQLAYKQFHIGQYYLTIGNRQSANLYFDMVISNWPDSTAAKMARQSQE